MEFRHLKTFQTILKTGSFLQAAEQLQYAQSTITLHVQQLEAELGVKVFIRQGKKIQLTNAGKALESHVNILLHRAEMLHQEMVELVGGKTGHLRIGSIEPVASLKLPSLLIDFCREYPKIKLTLETGVTDVISQRVAEGKLDLALCSPPSAKLGLHFDRLFLDPMALLIPEANLLSHKKEIQVKDLAAERLLLTEANCPYRQVFEREISSRGVNSDSGLEITSLKVLQNMVQASLGIGIVPTAVADPVPSNTVLRQIKGLKLELPVGIALSSEKSIPGLALDRLIEIIKDKFIEPK
ncbi:LysR family transcriptional regulator [Waterburya agarophytonicola K14]|uniref:LysR family transcriptional regulator n=1 Tax=Waterburya agarophytonicola KI4 TaxID=2874699 RepID=A0A964FGD4_9CYAN|nr:LysR family transcriptional regulator [Waterburya agarophytonicola]MCC0177866.1 LysR family transcriptional regulator [Waterburya agarophytonicola KI4]